MLDIISAKAMPLLAGAMLVLLATLFGSGMIISNLLEDNATLENANSALTDYAAKLEAKIKNEREAAARLAKAKAAIDTKFDNIDQKVDKVEKDEATGNLDSDDVHRLLCESGLASPDLCGPGDSTPPVK